MAVRALARVNLAAIERNVARLRDRIDRTAAAIHGMSVPTQDKIWKRVRKERELLERLLSFDYLLISYCERVRERLAALTPEEWRDQARKAEIEAELRELEGVIRERQQLLLIV